MIKIDLIAFGLILLLSMLVVADSGFNVTANVNRVICGTIVQNVTLTTNSSTTSNCFIVGADNLTINCDNYFIIGDGLGVGFNTSGYDGTRFINCGFENFSVAGEFYNSTDTLIWNNTLINNTVDFNGVNSNATILNTTSSYLNWTADINSYLNQSWVVDVLVQSGVTPINGATVNVSDYFNNTAFYGVTIATGKIGELNLTQLVLNNNIATNYTQHYFNVNALAYFDSNQNITINESQIVTFTLVATAETLILDHYFHEYALSQLTSSGEDIIISHLLGDEMTGFTCVSNSSWLTYDFCPPTIFANESHVFPYTVSAGNMTSGFYDGQIVFSATGIAPAYFNVSLFVGGVGTSLGGPLPGVTPGVPNDFLVYPIDKTKSNYTVEEFKASIPSCKTYVIQNFLSEELNVEINELRNYDENIIVKSELKSFNVDASTNKSFTICVIIKDYKNQVFTESLWVTANNSPQEIPIPFMITVSEVDWWDEVIIFIGQRADDVGKWSNDVVIVTDKEVQGELIVIRNSHLFYVFLVCCIGYWIYGSNSEKRKSN